jgi:hypothetical protein
MSTRSFIRALRTRAVVRLDQFVSAPPFIQVPAVILMTMALVVFWAWIWSTLTGTSLGESLWISTTRFMDGGTMAQDEGRIPRLLAVAVTATGALVLSFLTGAFASKMGERIDDLRSGRSPVLQKNHILILGFDNKVPLLIRELSRSHQRARVVVLSVEEKARVEAQLRIARNVPRGKTRAIVRTGDPRSELSLLRVCAERARTIVVITPARLDDDHALRWTISTLLAIRRAVGPEYPGRLIVEARRATHAPLLALTCEPDVAGAGSIALDVLAADDIVARVIAQSIRQAGVYFALRELLSFRGSELYLEPIPPSLIGKPFDHAHDLIEDGIAAGVYRADGLHDLAPKYNDPRPLKATDRLIVLERDRRAFTLGRSLPHPPPPGSQQPQSLLDPQKILIIGNNRTLPRLIAELDRILPHGSTVSVSSPSLGRTDELALHEASRASTHIGVERKLIDPGEPLVSENPALLSADGVVILGCEDDQDPDGDASALSIMLKFRHARRLHGQRIKRLVTEVRDPAAANQVSGSLDDFLVSTDVVAMALAQACVETRLISAFRELLDPDGVEIFLVPRAIYLSDGPHTFAEVMAAARIRGEIAIGFLPHRENRQTLSARERIELGQVDVDEASPVYLNPPRQTIVPEGKDAMIVVLADPPEGRSWV